MPTKKQLHQIWATEFEFPWTRREDDPAYVSPEKAKRLMNEHKPPTMTLPQETIDQINHAAREAFQFGGLIRTTSKRLGYIAGATAEAEKALEREKVLLDALRDIASGKVLPQLIAQQALASYRKKEVGNG
jgi:hypothetical protein